MYKRQATDSWIYGIGDVDSRAVEKTQKAVYDLKNHRPKGNQDFRRFLDDRDVDAVVIATPDHWHAPMAGPYTHPTLPTKTKASTAVSDYASS